MAANPYRLSFGLIDERPVFMDERDDSYFLLDGELEASFLSQCAEADAAAVVPSELQEALGIEGDGGLIGFARCDRPRQSLLTGCFDRGRGRARLGDALPLAAILRRTRRSLAARPLGEILAELAETGNRGAAQDLHEQRVRSARRFLAVRPLIPVKANCLLDSLSLLRWLGSDRAGAMLVFGVKLDPFAAHCWVQAGDLILNDRVDHVERFGPVRVIRCSAATP